MQLFFRRIVPQARSRALAIFALAVAAIAVPSAAIALETHSPAPERPTHQPERHAQGIPAITEETVRQALTQVHQAANQGDIEGMLRFLAADAFIEMTVQLPSGEGQTLRFNRDDYAANVRQSFQQLKTYQSSFRNLKTQVAADGKSAIAIFDTFEEGTTDRYKIRSASSQVVILELRQGKLRATSIRTTVRMTVDPS